MKWWTVPGDSDLGRAIAAETDPNVLLDRDEGREAGRVNCYTSHWRDLEPRVIDSDAVAWFRHGNCAALALAMHDLTGWPLVVVAVPAGANGRSSGQDWAHALVRAPSGDLVDITGTVTDAGATAAWIELGPTCLQTLTRDAFVARVGGDLDSYPPLEAALVLDFAAHVTKSLDPGVYAGVA